MLLDKVVRLFTGGLVYDYSLCLKKIVFVCHCALSISKSKLKTHNLLIKNINDKIVTPCFDSLAIRQSLYTKDKVPNYNFNIHGSTYETTDPKVPFSNQGRQIF